MVADEHHEEYEEDEEECTVFQKEVGEEKEEMLDSRSNSSEQSLEEEQSEGESQPSLSFVTVKDEVSGVGRVVVEGEGDESEDEEVSEVVAHTLKVEKKVDEVEAMGEQEEEDEKEGIHLHFKMDTTLRAKDRVYISSYGNQV